MHKNKIMKKAIVFGIFLLLFIGCFHSITGKTNNTNESKNILLVDCSISTKGSSSCNHMAYIRGPFTVDCLLYEITLNNPEDPTCVCSEFPTSSGGTWTNDGVIITSQYGSGVLLEIDPETCEVTTIGGGGVSLNGIAYDPIKEVIYGCTGDDLFEIDRETGKQEYIGPFHISSMIGLACDADGELYGWDLLTDNLWKVDKRTAKVTLVGPLGIDLSFNQDGDFCKMDDILYLAVYTSSKESYLYECDEETGNCTLVGQFPDNTQVTLFTVPWNLPPIADFYWTPEHPDPGEPILFDASDSYDPNEDIILYKWDWNDDGEYDESNAIPTATHIFEEIGFYNVTLEVQDSYSVTDNITKIIRVGNRPPEKPIIEKAGKYAKYHLYNLTPMDPDNDTVYVRWDWDEGDITDWLGPFDSGEKITEYHEWKRKGTYTIRAQVKDEFGAESEWGELEVNIPRIRMLTSSLILMYMNKFPIIHQLMRIIKLNLR